MSKVLIDAGYDVISSDIWDYGYGDPGAGFLTAPLPKGAKHIVTNPPFKLAQKFIERGLDLIAETGGKAVFLLRHEYDCAASRVSLFDHPTFARKLTLIKRPRWINGTTVAPRHNYAWFVWDAAYEEKPTIGHLRAPVLSGGPHAGESSLSHP